MSNIDFSKPLPEALVYEDKKLYACLASYPITPGHIVIVWKEKKRDLHLLSRKDYDYLMDKVDVVRNAMLKTLKLKKVYLIYSDEVNRVHWHLIPRYEQKGFTILIHKPHLLKNFELAAKIKRNIS